LRKPPSVVYNVDEIPPPGVMFFSGVQHVGMMAIYLVYPVLLAQAAGVSADTAAAMVGLTLVALAVGTMLQVIPVGPFGSGFLCQPIPSIVYLVPSLLAAKHGGLPLVFGMTIAAGVFEMALARGLRNLRPLFPPEVAGLVVLLIGIATGMVGLRNIIGPGAEERVSDGRNLTLALITFVTMVALNVWGRGNMRLFCVLIGMAVGYGAAFAIGILGAPDLSRLREADLIAIPSLDHVGWSFDAGFALPFAVVALAAALKVAGNVTTCQKACDLEWTRADMRSISRGVLADGLATAIAGGMGAHGLNSSTASVGLASATGILSRRIAYAIAAMLLLLALVPKLGLLFYLMPRPVAGAALVFSATFIIVNGFQIITSRLLDARKTLVIGLALVLGLAVDVYPTFFLALPAGTLTTLGTSLVVGTLAALILNAAFRLGMRRTQTLTVPASGVDVTAIEDFMESRGGEWGARRDVIDRAKFNLAQSIEIITENCEPHSPLEITTSFDEFRVDIGVSYVGPPLELPDKRPSNEEIMETEEGHRRLAGFLLRRQADRVAATHKAGRSTVLFHFDH
jgi:NCS2 family nucleobase:cation symporter-2